jgi:hypothetical protein
MEALIPLSWALLFVGSWPTHGYGLKGPAVQPWVIEHPQEKCFYADDRRTLIRPPIEPGKHPQCDDLPDRAAILRSLPRATRGVPGIYEEFRDNMEFVVEKLVDSIDAPRFFPLIGPAQLHHCHYKCTVYFDETIKCTFPMEIDFKRRRSEVVCIDRDHLHLCPANSDVQGSEAEETGK